MSAAAGRDVALRRAPHACIVSSPPMRQNADKLGVLELFARWIVLVILAGALLLPGGTSAIAQSESCPMAKSMDCGGMTADPCCDHGKSDFAKSCKPGMACQTSVTATVLPSETAAAVMVAVVQADIMSGVARAPASHPPDRTLRPPILH